jgi:murein DD-endopeptidase MepM/ murein hydrolase activator NlpD
MLDKTFNPYEGHRIERAWDPIRPAGASRDLIARSVDINDNPGFAPAWESHSVASAQGGDVFPANGVLYTHVTGVFNQEYFDSTNGRNQIYHHEGVDFRGSSGTAIHSFIYGRVINLGWHNSTYGRIMIIANERGRGIYLLAHLSGIAPGIVRGSRIEPGDVVAYVGGSGMSGGISNPSMSRPHLHLEYYAFQYSTNDDTNDRNLYFIQTSNQNLDPPRTLQLQRGTNLPLANRNIRNPFSHEERLGQPQ